MCCGGVTEGFGARQCETLSYQTLRVVEFAHPRPDEEWMNTNRTACVPRNVARRDLGPATKSTRTAAIASLRHVSAWHHVLRRSDGQDACIALSFTPSRCALFQERTQRSLTSKAFSVHISGWSAEASTVTSPIGLC